MKEIFINVDFYNSEGIKTIQGNNNAEIYKIYVSENKRRLNLANKTIKLGYVMAGTTKGDIIENLNITNAEQGEITFPITNRISKQDGVYSCQLAIYGADGFLEHTATFGLTVEANIFNKIADEIVDTKDLTYIERILEEATNVSEELKSNIPVARQLNIDLENQNRILNENMDRANEVNNTLITTTEQSKVAATDAIEKKSQLENSITKAKEFIDGLDGSQNIPQLRLDVTELQNGLKSNQALSYEGSSISANNTLEGRTEGMRIKGKTMYKKKDGTYTDTWEKGVTLESFGEKEGNKISILSHGINFINKIEPILLEPNKANTDLIECDIPAGRVFFSAYDDNGEIITDNNIAMWFKDENNKNIDWWSLNGVREIELKRIAKSIQFFTNNNLQKSIIIKSLTISIDPHTKYEPYIEDGKNILIKEPLREDDYLYENNRQVKINRISSQYTFTGDEDIAKWVDSPNACWFTIKNNFKMNYGAYISGTKLLCGSLKTYNHGEFSTQTMINNSVTGITAFEDYFTIRIEKSKLTTQDVEGFKAWLKANPTTVVYQLAEPVVEIVDGVIDIDLDTYQERTYFNILNSLPGTLDFKVPSNIASIVQNTAREVNNIWDIINNLLVPSIVKANGNLAMIKLNNNLK
ncbi:BppU family phage baseplate upper protein [Clostridium perfringens]